MRAWYVDRRNEPILDVRMIVSFACALVLVLTWLLPREESFRQMLAEGQADHVSIAYARLLISMYPDDVELRMLLAAQYRQIGELGLAWAVINTEGTPPSALRATLILELAYASKQRETRQEWEKLLEQDLLAAVAEPTFDEEVLGAFARAAYAIDEPGLAARFFEQRFLAHGDSADLQQAVTAWRAADQSLRAAALFAQVDGAVSESVVQLALDTFLASGQLAPGLVFIDRWLRDNEPSPDMAYRFIEFAQSADSALKVEEYFALLGDTGDLPDDALLRLAGAAIAASDLDRAARFMETLLQRQPDDLTGRERLAGIYRWGGRPEEALAQWLILVEQTGTEQYIVEAWALAQGLYRYEVSSRLLTHLASIRRLTDAEAAALRTAYELQGQPDEAIGALIAYLDHHPGHRSAWRELIDLQEDNEYFKAASVSWLAFDARHPVDVKERLQWADLLWEQYLTEEAVALMLAAGKPDYPEFWLRLSSYAWFLDDMVLVARAYHALSELQPLERDQYQQYVVALIYTDPAAAGSVAMEAWRQLGDPEFFIQALQESLQSGDRIATRLLIAEALAHSEQFNSSPEFWELLAYYYQTEGDLLATRQHLERAVALHPQNTSLLSAYLWALIQGDDLNALAATLQANHALAEKHSELWLPMASGYARLDKHTIAANWFALAVALDSSDLEVLLAYAGSLEAMGRVDPAYRIRRHVIGELAAGGSASGFTLATLASAGDGILSSQNQLALASLLLASGQESFQPGQLAGLYLAQALRTEHYTAARYWLQRDAGADVWQRLAVAADERDTVVLKKLLVDQNREVRVQAAIALELPGNAYREALAGPGSTDRQLHDVASLYYNSYPSGWQIEPGHTYLSGLAIDAATFRIAGQVAESPVSSTLAFYQLTDAERLLPGQIDEVFWGVAAARRNRFGELQGSVSLLHSVDELIPGFTLEQQLRVDRRSSFYFGAAYQQLTEITALSRAATQRSGLNAGWLGFLSRRDQLTLNTSWDLYQSRFGGEVGRGGQLQLRYDHALLLAGPNVTIGSELYMTRNSVEPLSDALSDELLVNRDERLLPDATNRMSIHASISRGFPGELRWDRPSPRYRLGAAVGYQWPENAPTLDFEASVGVRLLGNDELSLKTAYTSALLSGVGGEGYRASLVYSKRLGR